MTKVHVLLTLLACLLVGETRAASASRPEGKVWIDIQASKNVDCAHWQKTARTALLLLGAPEDEIEIRGGKGLIACGVHAEWNP